MWNLKFWRNLQTKSLRLLYPLCPPPGRGASASETAPSPAARAVPLRLGREAELPVSMNVCREIQRTDSPPHFQLFSSPTLGALAWLGTDPAPAPTPGSVPACGTPWSTGGWVAAFSRPNQRCEMKKPSPKKIPAKQQRSQKRASPTEPKDFAHTGAFWWKAIFWWKVIFWWKHPANFHSKDECVTLAMQPAAGRAAT